MTFWASKFRRSKNGKTTMITKLISNARTDGFRSVGFPNSKNHFSSLFLTFYHFKSLFPFFTSLRWEKVTFWDFYHRILDLSALKKRLASLPCSSNLSLFCALVWPVWGEPYFHPALSVAGPFHGSGPSLAGLSHRHQLNWFNWICHAWSFWKLLSINISQTQLPQKSHLF